MFSSEIHVIIKIVIVVRRGMKPLHYLNKENHPWTVEVLLTFV